MKNKIWFATLLLVFGILSFSGTVYADTTIRLDIETSTGSLYNQNITVAPCDSDNDPITPDTESAYCAVLQSGLTNNWSWFGTDAFLDSISSAINNDNNNGIYWGWFSNLDLGQTALNKYTLVSGDSILLSYNINPLKISVDNQNGVVGTNINFTVTQFGYDESWNAVWTPAIGGKIVIDSNIFDLDTNGKYSLLISDTDTITVKGRLTGFLDSPEMNITPQGIVVQQSGGGGRSSSYIPPTVEAIKEEFDLKKALDFIILQQEENGSFGEDIYTDWVSIAIASLQSQNQNIQSVIKLIKYLGENKISGTRLTDYERHAMTLMSLGLNPYNTAGENYIKKITDSFDGEQFGDKNEDNDDIFALIVLQNASFTEEDKMIASSLAFVLNRQKENGSWDESVDMTGAAIGALAFFNQNDQVKNSLTKAREFLKKTQKDTGGWGNVSSTAWAMEGILALNEKPEDWIKNDKTPFSYLTESQNGDGGLRDENLQSKIWETSYVLTALSSKTWNQIMQKFEKPKEISFNIELETTKKVFLKTTTEEPQKLTKNIKNTATVINSLGENNTESIRQNWVKNFLDKIFNIF